MAAGGRQCLCHRRHVLNFRLTGPGLYLLGLLVLPGLLVSGSALAARALDDAGHFDASLLQIDEAEYLGDRAADVPVTTEHGQSTLATLMADKPTLLMLAYYGCGHSCPVTLKNLGRLEIGAAPEEFKVLILSFDPLDTLDTMGAAQTALGEVPDNWTFGLLDEAASRRLADSVGFRFFFSERDQVFVHPAVLVFLSPESEVMRYLFGAQPRARDIELALVESRNRTPRLGEVVDMFKLSCFQFDASRSRYVLHPTVIFGGAGIAMLGLVGLAALASRKHSLGDS